MSTQAGATFIYATLAADAALTAQVAGRIFEDVPLQDAPLPYVIFQSYAPTDVTSLGATRLWTNNLWIVKGVARTLQYKGTVKTIADRIDAVLHAANGTTVDGTVWACTREREIRYPEQNEGGDQVRHLGGIYRIMAT
jgi:hypothetical protein